MRERSTYQLDGTGPKGTVCLLMFGRMSRSCGIGDDIAILPIVAELCKTHTVTIYTVHPEIFASVGATVHSMDSKLEWASDGTLFTSDWDGNNLALYERIFKMGGGCIWEDSEYMEKSRPRFEVYADMLGVPVPESFDYVAALNPEKSDRAVYTILASESADNWRTLPMNEAKELYTELSKGREVVWLGVGTVAHSWRELIDLVYNAEKVIAVDAGIAHLALALKKPTAVLGGITDARTIYSMYGGEAYFFQGTWSECLSPCWRQPSRGFRERRCCGTYTKPKCMQSIDIQQVLTTISGVNHAI